MSEWVKSSRFRFTKTLMQLIKHNQYENTSVNVEKKASRALRAFPIEKFKRLNELSKQPLFLSNCKTQNFADFLYTIINF